MNIECPNDETIANAFQDHLSKRKRDDLVNHVFNCPKCRIKFEALKNIDIELKRIENNGIEIISVSDVPVSTGEKKRPHLKNRYRYSYIAAATLFLIMAAGLGYLLLHQKKTSLILRDNGSTAVELIEPKGKLIGIPEKFIWSGIPDTDTYHIRIFDEDLNTIVNRGVTTNQYVLVDNEKRRIMKNKIYLWSVACINDAGEKIGFAQTYFEIR